MAATHPHDYDHDRPAPRRGQPPGRSAHAEASLSDALRVSFRILTVLMVLIVVAFLLRGFQGIDTTQRGVVLRFGRIVRITDKAGFVYTWPFPIGEIEKVSIQEKTLTVDDFWMGETPDDKTKPLARRTAKTDGLRPGYDGALLTADRYLLHVRLLCKYQVSNVRDWKMHVAQEEELIRSAVCAAAIRAAATRTADNLQRFQKDEFLNAVARSTRQALDRVQSGIVVRSVQLAESGMSWPLKALPAFAEVTNARSGMEQAINEARGQAAKILNDAAGPAYEDLVGHPWETPKGDRPPEAKGDSAPGPSRPWDLLGRYARAVRAGDEKQAAALLENIEAILTTSATGDVSRIIAEARAYSTEIRQRIESYAIRFEQLLKQLPPDAQGRRLMIERLWADARDEILTSPRIEKYYVSPGNGRFILRVARDSDIYRQIERERAKAAEEKPAGGAK